MKALRWIGRATVFTFAMGFWFFALVVVLFVLRIACALSGWVKS